MTRIAELWVEQVGSTIAAGCPLCGGDAHLSFHVVGSQLTIRSAFQRVTCDTCQVGFDSSVCVELGVDGSVRFATA